MSPTDTSSLSRTSLSYDLVIATRNRPDALELSIPLMLGQSRPPEKLIVVDSSDDHAPVAAAVAEATRHWDGDVRIHHSEPGLPRQRNIGLADVTAPIVFLFDDDSLLMPETAARIMAVYERDTDGVIAGVGGAETHTPPEGVLSDETWEMTEEHRQEARIRGPRNRLERRLTVLKPTIFLGRELNARHDVPGWMAAMDVVPVEYVTGFRMTFRTDVIRRTGFDENLSAYAVDEDIDASLSAMASGLMVAARRAQIYHHRRPGGRGVPYEAGRMTVANRAYVLLKHAGGPNGSESLVTAVWRRHKVFMLLKILMQLPKLFRADGRAYFAGVVQGVRESMGFRRSMPLGVTRPISTQAQ